MIALQRLIAAVRAYLSNLLKQRHDVAIAIKAIQSRVDVYAREQGVLNEAYDNLRRLDEDINYHRGVMNN